MLPWIQTEYVRTFILLLHLINPFLLLCLLDSIPAILGKKQSYTMDKVTNLWL